MFKHITSYPWTLGGSGLTVWGYEQQYGRPLVVNCDAKNERITMPTATKRANARLIAIAPQMYEIIQKMQSEDAKALVRYMEKEIDHADQGN
jgi:type IV secretory pathway TrbF-like protein